MLRKEGGRKFQSNESFFVKVIGHSYNNYMKKEKNQICGRGVGNFRKKLHIHKIFFGWSFVGFQKLLLLK